MMGQYNENDMVLQELNRLEEDATVYKLVGPVLLTQAAPPPRPLPAPSPPPSRPLPSFSAECAFREP